MMLGSRCDPEARCSAALCWRSEPVPVLLPPQQSGSRCDYVSTARLASAEPLGARAMSRFSLLLTPALLLSGICPSRLVAEEHARLREGRIAFREGATAEAIEHFRAAARDGPNPDAHLWLGRCFRQKGLLLTALRHLERARGLRPRHERTLRLLGWVCLELHDRAAVRGAYDRAEKRLAEADRLGRTLIGLDPSESDSYRFLVDLAARRNKPEDVLRYSDKVTEIDPNDDRVSLIEALVRLKRYAEAQRVCGDILRVDPSLQGPRLWISRIALFEGDGEQALAHLNVLLKQRPDHLEATLLRADTFLAMRQYEKAIEDADHAARLSPAHPLPKVIRGAAFMRLKKLDKALDQLREAAKGLGDAAGHSRYWQTHFMLARCLVMKDKYPEAIKCLKQALAASPKNLAARLLLANIHVQLLQYGAAIGVLEDARRHFPQNTEILRLLATTHLHEGHEKEARQCLEELRKLGVTPRDPGALTLRTPAGTIAYCLKALKTAPGDADVRFILGATYLRTGRLGEAKTQFEKVLELGGGRHPGARFRLAELHRARGEFALAERQLRRCIEQEPELTTPRYRLAELYAEQCQFDRALAELEKLLKLDPDKEKARRAIEDLRRWLGSVQRPEAP